MTSSSKFELDFQILCRPFYGKIRFCQEFYFALKSSSDPLEHKDSSETASENPRFARRKVETPERKASFFSRARAKTPVASAPAPQKTATEQPTTAETQLFPTGKVPQELCDDTLKALFLFPPLRLSSYSQANSIVGILFGDPENTPTTTPL